MNRNNKIMAAMLAVGAVGMVVAIEGDAAYGSRAFCRGFDFGESDYTRNFRQRTVTPRPDGEIEYAFTLNGLLAGSRYVCTATAKDDKVVKTAATHRWSI